MERVLTGNVLPKKKTPQRLMVTASFAGTYNKRRPGPSGQGGAAENRVTERRASGLTEPGTPSKALDMQL